MHKIDINSHYQYIRTCFVFFVQQFCNNCGKTDIFALQIYEIRHLKIYDKVILVRLLRNRRTFFYFLNLFKMCQFYFKILKINILNEKIIAKIFDKYRQFH